MNLAHLHVLITHFPVFVSFIGILVLLFGGMKDSKYTIQAAYYIFIISGIVAGIAYFTGEHAEHFIENLQGISHDAIEEHEEAAKFAWISAILSGLASIFGLYMMSKKPNLNNIMRYVILFLCLFGLSTSIRTAYLGGQIRHTEFNTTPISNGAEHDHD